MTFSNVYSDTERAEAYATLDFPGTYYLAFRDLPSIISSSVTGKTALDFGCGAGRSTRFLERLGFDAVGIDISPSMIELARAADPGGTYYPIGSGDFRVLGGARFDLILSAFPFDNIPGVENRAGILRGLAGLLADGGRLVLLGSTPEIYTHEWASFTTAEFPENRDAKSGETVRIIMKDVADRRPVVDLVWSHEDYLALFAAAGLELLSEHRPLGREAEPYAWLSETSVAPWVIYVTGRRDGA
jgi:SAM-dependent methyltransferase